MNGARRPGPTVGFFGLLGSGNLGNDASFEAVVTFLRSRHPQARLTAMCGGPERVRSRYGIPSVPLHWYDTQTTRPLAPVRKALGKVLDVYRTARFVRRCDLVVVPGMGVLETTLPMRPWGWPFTLFLLTASGRLLGTPTALVGVGADTIGAPVTRRLLTAAARLAHHRSYRDRYSKDALSRMGVDTSADDVHPDLVFALPDPPPGRTVPGRVGLGVMAFRGDNDDRARGEEIFSTYVAGIIEFAHWLLDRGYTIRLFTGDAVDDEVVAAVLDSARARTTIAPGAVDVEPVDDLTELMARIDTVELMIASRYHNVLSALKLGKPTIALGYGAKSDALMARMGIGDFGQSIRTIDVPLLMKQFARLEDERDQLRATLAESNAACRRELDDAFDRLSAVLFPHGEHGSA